MNILHLHLKKQWYDMIASGEKQEEYREIKNTYKRLSLNHYDVVQFYLGYPKKGDTSRVMTFEIKDINVGIGNSNWGAPDDEVYIIKLGDRLDNTMLEIYKRLLEWFQQMTDKYSWISFKYEYSKQQHTYLVSMSPSDQICQSKGFCDDSLMFSKMMYSLYGDRSPLFCDDEELFKLSENAKNISVS